MIFEPQTKATVLAPNYIWAQRNEKYKAYVSRIGEEKCKIEIYAAFGMLAKTEIAPTLQAAREFVFKFLEENDERKD